MDPPRAFEGPLPTTSGTAVFVSGVVSIGLELLAGRMVAPQFGSSIYTWGTIIGVFLAALSVGYHRGGRRARTAASNRRMALLFLGTAVYVAGLVVAGDLLIRATVAFPLPGRVASLPAVVLLFGPPTYLLGYVSPYAAELAETDSHGEASGRVYAIGTVGSIVGAFATTYLLIPELTVSQIGGVFGLLSVAVAALLYGPELDRRRALGVATVGLLVVAAVASGALGFTIEGQVVYESQTPYQQLQVIDRGDTRTLYLDGQRHSAMDLEEPDRHVFEYTRYFYLPYLFERDVDSVLFVGGGGFTGPKDFVRSTDATVDVAEIDPEVVDAAKRYFAVEESERLRIHAVGGRQFLRDTDRTYDLIVLDAYKKDKVPFQLTTEEFMRLADRRLAEDGVLVANVISAPSGPASRFYRAQFATMERVFPNVYGFPTAEGPVVQNIEMVATKNETPVDEATLRRRAERRSVGVDLDDAVDRYRSSEPTGDVPVLRDDHAPVDSLLDPMVGRRYVVQETGPVDPDSDASVTTTTANGTGAAAP